MAKKRFYHMADLARKLDRHKSTLLRWEVEHKLPPAKRDSRGWRYYTPDDFQSIIRTVQEQFYFSDRRFTH